jgi:hypothetical protein
VINVRIINSQLTIFVVNPDLLSTEELFSLSLVRLLLTKSSQNAIRTFHTSYRRRWSAVSPFLAI